MGFVPTGHRPIKSRHFHQAGDKLFCLPVDHFFICQVFSFHFLAVETANEWFNYHFLE
jgi:hypothetical protein